MKPHQNLFTKICLLGLVTFIGTTALFADAGAIMFAYGKVQIQKTDGQHVIAKKGDVVEQGDTLTTGPNGRAQLRMKDGATFDLKTNTEFVIDEYNFDAKERAKYSTDKKQEKSFYRLMRGGFRSISGLIGKKNKANYRVTTPVATIGIRGTDYTLVYCPSACVTSGGDKKPVGMYASVSDGGIVLENAAGSLDVDPGQSAFVKDANTAPKFSSESANSVTSSASTVVVPESTVSIENFLVLETVEETTSPDPVEEVTPIEVVDVEPEVVETATGDAGRVASTRSNGINFVNTGDSALLNIDASNGLSQYASADGTVYNSGTAIVRSEGVDPNTGVYWGRWSGGTAEVTNADGTTTELDLTNSSMHYIYTANNIAPVLPSTGTASFDLLGISATDNNGNAINSGTASLSANFAAQTVDADINLSLNNQTWDASATDIALDGAAATFSGDFDSVTVTDQVSGVSNTNASGSLDGFLAADKDSEELDGAAATFTLDDNAGTTVDGAAAFERSGNNP